MIGQQKRALELTASLPSAKFYKHFDEINSKTSKSVAVQAEASKSQVKHFSAAPVQSFCKSLNRSQMTSCASILNLANCARKSGLLEARGPGDWNSLDVSSKERGDVLPEGDKEICIREGKRESASTFQSYGARSALSHECENMASVGAQELQVAQTKICAKPCFTFPASRQHTLSEVGFSGASMESGDICLNKSRVGKLKLCLEECQTSTEDVSKCDLGIKQESLYGGSEIGCTARKVELWESKVEVTPCFPFNVTQNDEHQSCTGMSEHDNLDEEDREPQSMNLGTEVITKDYYTSFNSPTQTCPKGWENLSCGKRENQDPDCCNSNSERLQTIELIQADNMSSRKSKVITLSDDSFLDLNKDLGVGRTKPYQHPPHCHVNLNEGLVAAKEMKEKSPFTCLEESYTSARQSFEGRIPEHAVKIGMQAFWNTQSPSHSYVTEQTGPGSVCHGRNAYDGAEFEDQANLETPHRRVPLGPEFQAELPQLVSANKNGGFCFETYEPDTFKWLGECVWPVWESELVSSEKVIPSIRSTVCSCPVHNTVQCVRLHVEEEREILTKELGKAFYAWGFDDMGEAATKHWTCEEELTFHEVVRENPLSFWNELFAAFPARLTRELVSYYFNVFVLRRRAIQNRVNSWNIDSDDDEMVLTSEDEGSASLFESDEEMDETQVDDTASENDEKDDSLSHAGDDFGDEENIKVNSGIGESSFVVETTHVQDKHGLANASPEAFGAQICWMAQEKDILKHSSDGSDDARNQGAKTTLRAWDTPSWDQPNPCSSSQKEGKLEVPYVTCFVSDRQKSGDCSDCKEGLIINSRQCILDQCDTKVWDTPSLLPPSKDVDKLISTKGMMEEFFGAEF